MTVRTILVDDMLLARKRVRRYLDGDPDIEIIAECSDGEEAIHAIRKLRPDLVFIDVQMPEVDGFAVIDAIGPGFVPAVVFVTAYDEFALRAFEVHALDYLLKPFDGDRFRATVERAKAQLQRTVGEGSQSRVAALLEDVRGESRGVRRLAIRSRERTVFVSVADVDFVEAAGNYVRVHTGGESHLMRETLGQIEAKLDSERFARIHRSTIVNVERISEMHPMFNGDQVIVLRDGRRLTVSRTFREDLLALLERA